MTAFSRYAPFLQEYIYKQGWEDLREVQIHACSAILDRDNHVLISSGTASGKTEAAFFPILTDLHKNPSKSVGILYIGPLKALINDQFARLDGLLQESNIPVFPWHGDISQTVKKKALTTAQGIIQITPESLEAMLLARPGEAVRLFGDLRYVIIDEIHAFMGSDRGLQLICQLTRLERLTSCFPRRVGLSATLQDTDSALAFLTWGSSRGGEAVGLDQHARTIQLASHSYFIPEDPTLAEEAWSAYYDFMYEKTHTKKCLIFTNNRGMAEKTIANLKEIAEVRKEPDVFFVHHGSVAASLRQEVETTLRESDQPTVTAATLTLELGIDIGDLDFTLQLGAPYTSASFVQRLGRSGRRTGVSKMMFLDAFEEKDKDIFDEIPWNLLRGIAIIQLYAEEKWVEPFQLKKKPFSLLVHQTLSILMSYGGQSPSELARKVLTLPIFQDTITQEEFRQLLMHLLAEKCIQQMETGELIVGLTGEKFTNHFSFYAVFTQEETFRVQSATEEIGTLDSCPMVEEVFVLAGRTWQVTAINQEKKIIFVNQCKTRRVPSWQGAGIHIHRNIVQRMKKVLLEDKTYPYLHESACITLEKARNYVREIDLFQDDFIKCGTQSYYFCPWEGTRELKTLKHLLSVGLKDVLKINSVSQGMHYLQINCETNPLQWGNLLASAPLDFNDPNLVLFGDIVPFMDKYDYYVPPSLVRSGFLHNELVVPDALSLLKKYTV